MAKAAPSTATGINYNGFYDGGFLNWACDYAKSANKVVDIDLNAAGMDNASFGLNSADPFASLSKMAFSAGSYPTAGAFNVCTLKDLHSGVQDPTTFSADTGKLMSFEDINGILDTYDYLAGIVHAVSLQAMAGFASVVTPLGAVSIADQAPVNGTRSDKVDFSAVGGNCVFSGTGDAVVCTANHATTVTDSNATITVQAGATVVVTGSNDTVVMAAGASATITGSNEQVSVAGNDSVSLTGNAQVHSGLGNPDNTVSVTGTGTGNVVNCGSGDGGITVNLSNATINEIGYSGDVVTGVYVNGNSDLINLTGGSVVVNGTGDSVAMKSGGDHYNIWGTAGDTIGVTSNSSAVDVQIDGMYDTFNLGSNVHGEIYGSNQTLNIASSDSLTFVSGQSVVVSGANSTDWLYLGNEVGVTALGSGENIQVYGTGSELTADYANVAVTAAADHLDDYIMGSHDTFSSTATVTDSLHLEGQYDAGSLTDINVTIYGSNSGDTFSYGGGSEFDNLDTSTWNFGYSTFDPIADTFDPIVLNLTGGAVSTVKLSSSTAYFDQQNDGRQVHTGWGTAGEGYLVYDPNNTNSVTNERSLVPGFATLQGLDGNHDGVLNSLDAAWSKLKVWIDTTGNGAFAATNLKTLDAEGIASINLHSTHSGRNNNNNTILDDSTFAWKTGGTGAMAGVAFTIDANVTRPVPTPPPPWGGCVQVASLLPDGRRASEVVVDSALELADARTLQCEDGRVTYSQSKSADGWRIVTVSGVSLVCSDSAPIPTTQGLVNPPQMTTAHSVAVRKDEGGAVQIGWEAVASVQAIGPIEVQHISVNDKCFWAGERADAFILHHNKNLP